MCRVNQFDVVLFWVRLIKWINSHIQKTCTTSSVYYPVKVSRTFFTSIITYGFYYNTLLISKSLQTFHNMATFFFFRYGGLLILYPTPKIEDLLMSAVHELFDVMGTVLRWWVIRANPKCLLGKSRWKCPL